MADTTSPSPPDSLQQYRGNCHCGAFVYEVKLPDPIPASVCNCSLCRRKSYVWVRALPEYAFRVVEGGDGVLTSYTRNNVFHHKFCTKCGTAVTASSESLPAGRNMVLNIRTIQGPLDVWTMEKKPVDGASFPPAWQDRTYTGPEPSGGPADGKLYHGSCHCGKITVAVKGKPLEQRDNTDTFDRICECNCSFDQRAGCMWIYPTADEVVLQGREHASTYVSGAGVSTRLFCRTCGVYVMNEPNALTDEQVAALPDAVRSFRAAWLDKRPVNVRVFDNVGSEELGGLETQRFDGYHFIPPMYANP